MVLELPKSGMDDNFWREPARSDYLYHNKTCAALRSHKYMGAKEPVQPLAVLDSFLPYGKRSDILAIYLTWFISKVGDGTDDNFWQEPTRSS